ncbi:MAG: hypothetical protein JSS50_03540 [Proteobacteria bacterium]|nr:hypothetical protein [Pseudomonadota bacterium]
MTYRTVNPRLILQALGITLPNRTNSKGYWSILCPFHNDNKPSLNLHSRDGHFHCFGCGESGQLWRFYQLLTGKSEKEAKKHCYNGGRHGR